MINHPAFNILLLHVIQYQIYQYISPTVAVDIWAPTCLLLEGVPVYCHHRPRQTYQSATLDTSAIDRFRDSHIAYWLLRLLSGDYATSHWWSRPLRPFDPYSAGIVLGTIATHKHRQTTIHAVSSYLGMSLMEVYFVLYLQALKYSCKSNRPIGYLISKMMVCFLWYLLSIQPSSFCISHMITHDVAGFLLHVSTYIYCCHISTTYIHHPRIII